jgi:hypothetical protein
MTDCIPANYDRANLPVSIPIRNPEISPTWLWEVLLKEAARKVGKELVENLSAGCRVESFEGHVLKIGLYNPYRACVFQQCLLPVLEDLLCRWFPMLKIEVVVVRL